MDRVNRSINRLAVHTCSPECAQETGEAGKNVRFKVEDRKRSGHGSTWRTDLYKSDALLLPVRMKILVQIPSFFTIEEVIDKEK